MPGETERRPTTNFPGSKPKRKRSRALCPDDPGNDLRRPSQERALLLSQTTLAIRNLVVDLLICRAAKTGSARQPRTVLPRYGMSFWLRLKNRDAHPFRRSRVTLSFRIVHCTCTQETHGPTYGHSRLSAHSVSSMFCGQPRYADSSI